MRKARAGDPDSEQARRSNGFRSLSADGETPEEGPTGEGIPKVYSLPGGAPAPGKPSSLLRFVMNGFGWGALRLISGRSLLR